jgi:hypothetical protein
MTNSLQRIILIDTHLKGLVELKLNQHTNINGVNASGKTTLQRLVPVFYGAFPNSVVPKSRDKFARWYLPRNSSYIIYEYLNAYNELRQVALASKDGETVDYRFIAKGFSQQDYVKNQQDGKIECYHLGELKQQLGKQHVDCSITLNPTEYRAVIQNDKVALNSLAHGKNLRRYIRPYSLCQSQHNLRHIEKLLQAIHSKSGKMAAIKLMIEAILKEDGSIATPEVKLTLSDVEQWAKESAAVEHLHSHHGKLQAVLHLDNELSTQEQQLGGDYRYLQNSLSVLAVKIDELKIQLADKDQDRQNIANHWTTLRDQLSNQLSDLQAQQRTANHELDLIEKQFNEYLNSGIENLGFALANLPSWIERLKSLEHDLHALTEVHQEAKSRYEQRKNKVYESKDEQLNDEDKQKAHLEIEKSNLFQSQQQEIQSKEQLYRKKLDALKDEYQQKLHAQTSALSDLKAAHQHNVFSKEERFEQQVFKQRLQEAETAREQAFQAREQAAQQVYKAKQQRDNCDKAYFEATHKLKEAQAKQEQTRLLCYPNTNSLLKFLRTEKPDWRASIGKVIDPQLLEREDLKPELLIANDNSIAEPKIGSPLKDFQFYATANLFGISLDLERIATPPHAQTEEELFNALQQTEQQTQQAEAALTVAEKALAEANKQVKQTENTAYQAEKTIADFKKQIENIKYEESLVIAQHQQLLEARKQALWQQIQAVEKAILETKQHYQTQLEQKKNHYGEYMMELKASQQQKIAEIDNLLAAAVNRISDIKRDAQQQLQQIEKDYVQELAGKGVDITAMQATKNAIAELSRQIMQAEKRRGEYQNYLEFKQLKLEIRKPELLEQLQTARFEQMRLENQRNDAEQHYQSRLAELKQQTKQLTDLLMQYSQQNTEIKQALADIERLKIAVATQAVLLSNTISLAEYTRSSLERVKTVIIQRDDLDRQVTELEKSVYQEGGNKLTEAYEKERDALATPSRHQLVAALKNTFELLPQMLTEIRQLGRNYGKRIKDYYDTLKGAHQQITAQAARITRYVNEDLDLEDVSDSSVRIYSKITEQDYWPNLENFVKLYQDWEAQDFSSQPNTEYLEGIKEVARILGQGNHEKLVLLDLLDIELRLKEGHSSLIIRTDQELHDSSSHGMAYLILCKFLLAFTRMLRGNSQTSIHWPIDELGTLHISYIEKVFQACDRNRIIIVGALPNPDLSILKLFVHRYWLDKKSKTLAIIASPTDKLSAVIQARKVAELSHD